MTFATFDTPRVGDKLWMNHAQGFVRLAYIDEEKATVILVGGDQGGWWEWSVKDLVQVIHPVVRRDGVEGVYLWRA